MQHLEGSGTPVLYIGRTVLKGEHSITVRSGHTVFMCFVFISEQTSTSAPNSIN
jgi:hypothetical protein